MVPETVNQWAQDITGSSQKQHLIPSYVLTVQQKE